jgi:hypothetical protein
MTLDGNVIATPWAPGADELAESTSASLVPAGHLQNAVEIFTKGGMKAIPVRLAEEAERKVREADDARPKAVRADIIATLEPFVTGPVESRPLNIADAIMDGLILHVKVVF